MKRFAIGLLVALLLGLGTVGSVVQMQQADGSDLLAVKASEKQNEKTPPKPDVNWNS